MAKTVNFKFINTRCYFVGEGFDQPNIFKTVEGEVKLWTTIIESMVKECIRSKDFSELYGKDFKFFCHILCIDFDKFRDAIITGVKNGKSRRCKKDQGIFPE